MCALAYPTANDEIRVEKFDNLEHTDDDVSQKKYPLASPSSPILFILAYQHKIIKKKSYIFKEIVALKEIKV